MHDIGDPASGFTVTPIAGIVHDSDLNDSKFERQETLGIERLIAGIAMAHKDHEMRLSRGTAVFDDLYEFSGENVTERTATNIRVVRQAAGNVFEVAD